jgi:divalent metal cation (Fe/Co/Zn/Cd) transporter
VPERGIRAVADPILHHDGGAGADRQRWLAAAVRWEVLALVWIALEAVLSLIAAARQGGLALSAFGVDSAIELVSGLVLLLRLGYEWLRRDVEPPNSLERWAAAIVAGCLFALTAWIAFRSGQALAHRQPAPLGRLGLFVAAASSLVTPWLAMQKRRLGRLLASAALLGDAACTMTCAYMAWVLLAGSFCQAAFGWWWVDPVAALGILYFVLGEAWESFAGARDGRPHGHEHGVV